MIKLPENLRISGKAAIQGEKMLKIKSLQIKEIKD
jgi:hypothetical protein